MNREAGVYKNWVLLSSINACIPVFVNGFTHSYKCVACGYDVYIHMHLCYVTVCLCVVCVQCMQLLTGYNLTIKKICIRAYREPLCMHASTSLI